MGKETDRMEKENKIKPRSVKPSITGFLALVSRLLFFTPIWTDNNQQHQNIRFIHVNFSAWHFAGSDMLWAGIAIRLFQSMQMNFGKLQLVLHRVAQHDEEDELRKKIVEKSSNCWKAKKICCCPVWLLFLCILVIPPIILVFLLTFSLPKPELEPSDNVKETDPGSVGMMEGMIIAVLGVPVASALRFIILMIKNLIYSQEMKIKKGLDNEQVSNQLGFMNEVRKEMWFLSQFIQFMEIFERRRIRVVLTIVNLDRCTPKKIVAVLDAINILLSDEESPFISILAVNPSVIVEKVNFADGCFSEEDRAYALLNRIVTLAFTVPPLCDDSKSDLFHSLTSKSESRNKTMTKIRKGSLKRAYSKDLEGNISEEDSEPFCIITTTEPDIKEEDVESLINSSLRKNESTINKYMSDDAMSMRRVINSIRVTVIIMKALKKDPKPEDIVAWVVLANQWPCRLSWIIQCAEDDEQRANIDRKSVARNDDSKTLWKVFSESRAELYVMSAQIEDLLEQDGDPEMFETFLTKDFPFTIKDLKTFKVATVNLDHTMRKVMAQIRGTSRLKDSGWMRNLAPLPITTIINMDTQDVCNELERMKYPSKYIEKVKGNGLNGSALLFGNVDDLKDLLGMNFGEWATFRLHFLGLPYRLLPQHKNMPPPSLRAQRQFLRCDEHFLHHSSSNHKLAKSPM
uniref:NTPase, KAP family P-loop domain containing 1 n=2 Tax=Echeneis naucrates TaxID=173247 RepID=A0A665W9D3_ECHNA